MISKDINSIYNNKINIHLSNFTSRSICLGILLSIIGGFLDAYTFIGRGGVFANAQTGNIVLVGIEIFKGNWIQASIQVLPIFAFIIGVIISEIFKKSSSIFFVSNPDYAVLLIEIVILFIIGFVPYTFPNAFINTTISFIASLQYCSFNKVLNYTYATTMCTGNLRVASQAIYIAIAKKDPNSAIKAISYFIIIFSFLVGAFLGAILTSFVGTYAVWFTIILLIFCVILLN